MTSVDLVVPRKLRVLFVTQWFEPEPAFKGIRFARALAEAGHEVRVVTGFPNYPGGKLYPGYRLGWRARETMDGIVIDRLALWPSHDHSSIGRTANYLSFFVSVLLHLFRRMRRFDVVYVYHPPLTPGLAAAIAGRVSGTPFIIDIQDLWPDSVAVSGMANRGIVRVLRSLCEFVYDRASLIVCQSKGMVEMLGERGVPIRKLRYIYNWSNYVPNSDDDRTRTPDEIARSFEGHFNIVYGGNLGQAQALDCLVAAAIDARRKNQSIKLHLFGNGIEKPALEKLAKSSCGAVELHGARPREVMDRIFEAADALALHLKDDPLFRHTIPSKLQHYISVGRPILAGIAGEGAKLLERSGSARIVAPMDVEGLSRGMQDLAALSLEDRLRMSCSAKEFYNETLSFGSAISRTLEIIQETVDLDEQVVTRKPSVSSAQMERTGEHSDY